MVSSLLFLLWLQPQAPQLAQLFEQELLRLQSLHGPDSPESARAALNHGLFLLRNNNAPLAVAPLSRAFAVLQDDPTLEALAQAQLAASQAAEAVASFTTLSQSKDPARAARALTTLADLNSDRSAACPLYQRAIALEDSIPRRNDLGLCLRETGQLQPAIAQFRQALLRDPQSKDPETAITLNNLASALLDAKVLPEAELLQRKAFSLLDQTLGPRHPRTALSASNLADILVARNKIVEARRLYQFAYQVFLRRLGPQHPWTIDTQASLESALRP